ncbi:MAG TPA: hypothetical protein VF173_01330 [Thermoanaerobaculia bacterium]|nr:hypothetical protein [Thermoanaerobaculia bacterium]
MHALPAPPPGAAHYSDYQPAHPFLPWQDGVARRLVYKTDAIENLGGLAVEVRDFLVSSMQTKSIFALDGAAVIEVRQGSGEVMVGEQKLKLLSGTVFTVGKGEPLSVISHGEPITFRAWIVSPGGQP